MTASVPPAPGWTGGAVRHVLRCGCLLCQLREHLAGHVRCRACGAWAPRGLAPSHVAVIDCGERECRATAAAYVEGLRREGRPPAWAHNPGSAGSTPAPATAREAA